MYFWSWSLAMLWFSLTKHWLTCQLWWWNNTGHIVVHLELNASFIYLSQSISVQEVAWVWCTVNIICLWFNTSIELCLNCTVSPNPSIVNLAWYISTVWVLSARWDFCHAKRWQDKRCHFWQGSQSQTLGLLSCSKRLHLQVTVYSSDRSMRSCLVTYWAIHTVHVSLLS